MKRKLFIGSSQKNGSEIATQVERMVNEQCGSWLECDVWNSGKAFPLNESTLNSLATASRKYDYGIFIATKDDKVMSRDTELYIPRDNVVFEMGLFIGSMGTNRSFFLVEDGSELPSDFKGITVPIFNRDRNDSLALAVDKLIFELEKSKTSYNLRPIPSATLALGYFDNFLEPFARLRNQEEKRETKEIKIILPANINDVVDKSKFNQLIEQYAELHPSEDISVFKNNARPTIKRLKSNENLYWDIPTTLHTLKKLLDKVLPSTNVVDNNIDKNNWIKDEIDNFRGAITELVNRDTSFMKLSVRFYWLEYRNNELIEIPCE